MRSKNISLNVLADVRQYQQNIAKIPGITQREAARAAVALEKRLSKAQFQAAEDARKAAQKAARSWKDSFAGITLAITPQDILAVSRSLFDLAQSVADYNNELSDASVRTGLTTQNLAGLRLAAMGSGLQFSELNGALAKVALQGKDANVVLQEFVAELQTIDDPTEAAALAAKKFGEEAGPRLLQALGGTNAELKPFVDFAERYGARLGPEAAQASSDWQRQTAALDVAMKGLLQRMFPLEGLLSNATEFAFSFAAGSMAIGASFQEVARLAQDYVTIVSAIPANLERIFTLDNERRKELELQTAASRDAARSMEDAFGERFTGNIRDALGGLHEFRTSLDAVVSGSGGSGLPALTEAVTTNTSAVAANREEVRKLPEDWTYTTEQILAMRQEALAANREFYAQQMAEEDAWLEKVQAVGHELDAQRDIWHQEEMRRQQEQRDFKIGLAQQSFQAVANLLHATAGESKKAAQAAAIADKASAIFGVGVNTAQAIAKSIALFGPPVPPNFLGIAGVASAGAIGLAQGAAIAAQPLPTFHTGTAEVPAMLTPGEAVLAPRAAEAIGRSTVDALNKGMPVQSGPSVAVLHWNRRAADRVLSEVARADGAFNEAIRSGSTVTMRTPYR